uniref:DEAD-box ATP-dependent RNA helicase 41 n=1 Tax=Oryza rufipogon TaxID=4529 RepID=A0A0E0NY09_ORYRU
MRNDGGSWIKSDSDEKSPVSSSPPLLARQDELRAAEQGRGADLHPASRAGEGRGSCFVDLSSNINRMEQEENHSADHLSAQPGNGNELEESSVKERCFEQREALVGEPRCVICGRYGEYICDQTDDDICSVECKTILLSKLSAETRPVVKAAKRVNLPVGDESFCIRDENFPKIPSMHDGQIASLRSKLDICVKGEDVPDPIMCFSSSGLPEKLVLNLEAAGYVMPTPVQMQVIPSSICNRSLLVSADTGSGKTASFLVPIIAHCSHVRSERCTDKQGPLAIVLAPTRELCLQVEEQAKVLGKGLPFKTALVVGGDPLAQQIYRIENGIELIVGTPGRLIDLLMKHNVDLNKVDVFVLDEVDCLLERGFRDQVMQIFQALSHPQVMMFSATVNSEVEKMSNSLAKNAIHISCGNPSRPNKSVKQVVIWVESKQKKQKIFEIMTSKQHFKPPAVVFVSSRIGADLLSEAITVATGLKVVSIHGDKTMNERRESLRRFLTGEVSVVVCTGVLGRGMDLLKVRQVILFDMPNSIDEYVHQVGRASRMGVEGMAIVFVNEEDRNLFRELVQILKTAGAPIPRELANSKYTTGIPLGGGKKRKLKSRKFWNHGLEW